LNSGIKQEATVKKMQPKGDQVNQMFANIADDYDTANHLLSFGIDYLWRAEVTKRVKACSPSFVVDLATGSGDLAFALKKRLGRKVEVRGMDFCQSMLDVAEKKKATNPLFKNINFSQGDCLNLPLDDNTVDVFTIAFGFRNFENRAKGLEEAKRVLKKENGHFFILEFTQPANWFKPFYYFYLKNILPFIASLVTKDKGAYNYLADSIEAFPTKEGIAKELETAGFKVESITPMTFSTVVIHHATTV
tara:strand:+ start:232 stop:975 length:744 start_codon:yes stop_codon:yes gene_type:complete